MDLNKVAERFKELRFRTKKSQMELADMLGVDQKRISRTEQGQQDLNGAFLESLKEQTNVNINWLLFGEGEMFSANTGSNIETMPVYKMWVEPGKIWTPEIGEKEAHPLTFDKSIFISSFRVEETDAYRFAAFRMRGKAEDMHINNNELFIAKLQDDGDQSFYGWAFYIYQWYEAICVGYLSRINDKELAHYYRTERDGFKLGFNIPVDKNLHIIGRVRLVMSQH